MRKGENALDELANNIAAIMENPATPVALFNAMADALTDLAGQNNQLNVDAIKRALRNVAEIASIVG